MQVFSIYKLFSHFSSNLAKLLPEKFSSSAGSWATAALGTAAGHSRGGYHARDQSALSKPVLRYSPHCKVQLSIKQGFKKLKIKP